MFTGDGGGVEESVDAGVLARLAVDDALNGDEATREGLLRRVNWGRSVSRWCGVNRRVARRLNRSVVVRRVSGGDGRWVSVVVVRGRVGRSVSRSVDRGVNRGDGRRVRVRVRFGMVVVVAVSGRVGRGGYWVCIVAVVARRHRCLSFDSGEVSKNGEGVEEENRELNKN